MISPSNRLTDFQRLYQNELKNIYGATETDSLFLWAAEEILSANRTELESQKDRLLLSESEMLKFWNTLKLLKKHCPIQYIFQKAYFYDLVLQVTPDVLIPRPETEELYLFAQKSVPKASRIMDLCCGSGCLALSLKKSFPSSHVDAMDFSPKALDVAKINSENLNLPLNLIEDDLLDFKPALYPEGYDLIVSNPPYVRNAEKQWMRSNVLDYEPHTALFVDDENPLIFYQAISRFARKFLSDQGLLWVEINECLGEDCSNLFLQDGFTSVSILKDLQGKDRFLRIQGRK